MAIYTEVENGKSNTCPSCGSIKLNYGAVTIDGSGVNYPFVCKDCEQTGKECYDLEFSGIWIPTPE